MQFDPEGMDDVVGATGGVKSKPIAPTSKLEQHFREHGMSARGYEKIKNDVDNGDMIPDILVEFDENELVSMANEYKLTTLQRKAFIKAVKSLPNSKAIVNVSVFSGHDQNEQKESFVNLTNYNKNNNQWQSFVLFFVIIS